MAISALRTHAWWLIGFGAPIEECSGQPMPDTVLSFSSATAGATPSLN